MTNTSPLTVGAISSEQTVSTLQIQQVIREELARELSLAPFLPSNTRGLTLQLRQTFEEQVCEVLPPTYQPPPVSALLTYADIAQKPAHAPSNIVDCAPQTNAFYATRVPAGTIDETYSYAHKEPPQRLPLYATSDTPPPSCRAFNQHRSPFPRRRSPSPMLQRAPPAQT
ncbi:hypothetical protein HPB51_010922 [Rhipicephalus microplus]|uniref:Uncharacterized protein n=1 Tax=Rhipicephalus microplus TaxID=6941 RepID=A0A9J6D4X4_RHIMP|nr:hypothetical protein HPB51_010922 [Rhipicephalus microplus]